MIKRGSEYLGQNDLGAANSSQSTFFFHCMHSPTLSLLKKRLLCVGGGMHTLHSLLRHFSCAAGFKQPHPTWSSTFTSIVCTHKQLWPRSTGIYNRLNPSHLQSEQNTSAAWAAESSETHLIVLSCRVLEGNARRIKQHLRVTILKPWERVLSAFQLS